MCVTVVALVGVSPTWYLRGRVSFSELAVIVDASIFKTRRPCFYHALSHSPQHGLIRTYIVCSSWRSINRLDAKFNEMTAWRQEGTDRISDEGRGHFT